MSLFPALRGADILVTGHTGFTGTWACHWLSALGARVHGLAVVPDTTPSMFALTGAEGLLASHILGDIGEKDIVGKAVARIKPRAILHLAAQPLVLASYADPVTTFRTNALGTVHVLEAARMTPSVEGIVCVTTDKVYENTNDGAAFDEAARIGGHDPYAASKAAAEMAIAGYRASLPAWKRALAIDSARGGNIIGGGDWSANRLVPDYVRSVTAGEPLVIRNPQATRPWQHVLCLLHGYLALLDRVLARTPPGSQHDLGDNWNFGPATGDAIAVNALLDRLSAVWKPAELRIVPADIVEKQDLSIDSTKAAVQLGWRPSLGIDAALAWTAEWYRCAHETPDAVSALTFRQIADYERAVRSA
jgi:CDP-glucose 4,6-dehydratase